MAEIAVSCGVDTIVATPHANQIGRFENFYGEELETQYHRFQRILKAEHLPLNLLLGMEISSSSDIKEKIQRKELIGLNGSKYFLVEFPFEEEPEEIEVVLKEIQAVGKIPLIAHPERYDCIQDYPVFLYQWLQMGCLSQINRGSLFGRFGRNAYHTAQELLDCQLVTCISSDAHGADMRTPFMGDAMDYIADQFGEGRMWQLFEENPRKILRNEEIISHGQKPEQNRYFI